MFSVDSKDFPGEIKYSLFYFKVIQLQTSHYEPFNYMSVQLEDFTYCFTLFR